MTTDPNSDPLADPELARLVVGKWLRGADHPWELEAPPNFDPIDACNRFMTLAQRVNEIVGEECLLELWPAVRQATFHGEIVLPPSATAPAASAVIRASNFGDLITVLDDEADVAPGVAARLQRSFARVGYRYVPASALRAKYDGHHRGTRHFDRWRDRYFGYLGG